MARNYSKTSKSDANASSESKDSNVYTKSGSNARDNKRNKRGKQSGNRNKSNTNKGNGMQTKNANMSSTINNIISASANLPFTYRTGEIINYNAFNSTMFENADMNTPGILRIGFTPTIGTLGRTEDSAITAAVRTFFSALRKVNSGKTNYEAPEVYMYLQQIGSIISLIKKYKRIYGVMNGYTWPNKYMPNSIMESLGIAHPQALSKCGTQLMSMINNCILELNSLVIPVPMMGVFFRQADMDSMIYRDAESDKSQLYIFDSDYYYRHDLTNGKLEAVAWTTINSTTGELIIDEMYNRIRSLFQTVKNNSVYPVIAGDMLRAFESSYKEEPLEFNYVVEPVYDLVTLLQIHNLTLFNASTLTSFDIEQDLSGYITQNVVGTVACNAVLNLPIDYPSSDAIYAVSRWVALKDTADSKAPVYCGTELITSLNMYIVPATESTSSTVIGTGTQHLTYTSSASARTYFDQFKFYFYGASFDWFPQGFIYNPTTTSTTITECVPTFDIRNVSLIRARDIKNIHRATFWTFYGIE